MNTFLQLMYDPEFIMRAGFVNGFLSNTNNSKLMARPLSTVLGSLMNAAIMSKATSVVLDIVPEYTHPFFSAFLIASSIFYIKNGGSDKPLLQITFKSNNNNIDFKLG